MEYNTNSKKIIKSILDNIDQIYLPKNAYEIINEQKNKVFNLNKNKNIFINILEYKEYKNNIYFIKLEICDKTPIFGIKCIFEVKVLIKDYDLLEIITEEIVFLKNY